MNGWQLCCFGLNGSLRISVQCQAVTKKEEKKENTKKKKIKKKRTGIERSKKEDTKNTPSPPPKKKKQQQQITRSQARSCLPPRRVSFVDHDFLNSQWLRSILQQVCPLAVWALRYNSML